MSGLFKVPGPVKSFFDQFPLHSYPAVAKTDDAVTANFNERTSYFAGKQAARNSPNEIFKLGVYNVYEEPHSGCILASDPWCLYTQLSLCKKNGLKLSSNPNSQKPCEQQQRHSMLVVSYLAASDNSLPILIESYSKRNVRSTAGINEILSTRLPNAEQILYVSLLDSVVYDCWITLMLCELSVTKFLQLYGGSDIFDSVPLQKLAYQNTREALMKRNDFSLRHTEIAQHIRFMNVYRAGSAQLLIQPLYETCKKSLLQFQTLLGSQTFFFNATEPGYLDIKLASYVFCFLNVGDDLWTAQFLQQETRNLVDHAQRVLAYYK